MSVISSQTSASAAPNHPVPAADAARAAQGFVLGSAPETRVLLTALQQATPADADRLMRRALGTLVQWQQRVPAQGLPRCDEAMLVRQLALFAQWCVEREFAVAWTPAQHTQWQRICRLLIDSALAQPVVAVHGAWTPRHLLLGSGADEDAVGIRGFEHAVAGAITHDLASLLRDACISWDEEQEIDWAVRWWDQARRAGLPVDADFGEFWRALEWTGLQRHLQVMGVLCRLKHRDGQAQDAADLPRFVAYASRVALRYGPLKPLLQLLEPMSGNKLDVGFTF